MVTGIGSTSMNYGGSRPGSFLARMTLAASSISRMSIPPRPISKP
jgi:hypothetical protein